MRVRLNNIYLEELYLNLKNAGYKISDLSMLTGYHERTIRDWRKGKFLMPKKAFSILVKITKKQTTDYKPIYINEYMLKSRAGSIGGKAQWQKNKSIGTLADKRAGGIMSYQKRKECNNDIFYKKQIKKPKQSAKLAEFIGICMGDGSITKYQVTISFNDVDDYEYMIIVKNMIFDLFNIACKIQKRNDSKCSNLVISSLELSEYLQSLGVPKGNKLRAGLDVPDWIKKDKHYSKVCIRGLFDTDGSVYLESHNINNKVYSYPRLSLVSKSANLRQTVKKIFSHNNINANIRMNRSVNIEKFTDIEKYFRIIGSSNPKHLRRFANYGGVG